ncbi:methyltransferase domain-containing protein [Candidatus Saccharibacteria bacterium]|jgi:16S rRNA A1518/A1519 N6-dimethyltransferase RsmA/KsgA/DIM1 with predicted DNA glycosylase/AP lyase activity|nr:methyltransferase domain-containing protein [Candidatus Saccharibacteria bacterium]
MKRLAHYSQYFLRSPDFIKELIGHTSIKPVDLVYDIGAGSGAITAVLADRVRKVVAIEFEPRMAEKLRENMERYPNVTVKEGDFLDMDLPTVPYKIFANIPFHLSSPIVRKITESDYPPVAAYLIVQKQFANKLLPNSDRFTGQLGMMIGPTFGVRIRRPLKRTDYFPHPNVDTALIEIKRRDEPFIPANKMDKYRKFIEGCFSDPKVFVKTPRLEIGLPADIKPSQMKLHQWVELFNLYDHK